MSEQLKQSFFSVVFCITHHIFFHFWRTLKTVLRHSIWGPLRPSWSLQQTLVVHTLRFLVSLPVPHIVFIRLLDWIPYHKPSNGRYQQINVEVSGPAEEPARVLPGEIVTYEKKTPKSFSLQLCLENLKSFLYPLFTSKEYLEFQTGNPIEQLKTLQENGKRLILYFHGGAYYTLSSASHRTVTTEAARVSKSIVYSVDYRLAPEFPFPSALYDAVAIFLHLIQNIGISPDNITIMGDSAGGGLCLALMLYLRDKNLPLPRSAVLFSPWVDLSCSSPSWEKNSDFDYLKNPNGYIVDPVVSYCGGFDKVKEFVSHPYISPLHGQLHDLPHILIQAGEVEVLIDDVYKLAHSLEKAGGGHVHLDVHKDMVHVFQLFPIFPATEKAWTEVESFLKRY